MPKLKKLVTVLDELRKQALKAQARVSKEYCFCKQSQFMFHAAEGTRTMTRTLAYLSHHYKPGESYIDPYTLDPRIRLAALLLSPYATKKEVESHLDEVKEFLDKLGVEYLGLTTEV